MNVANKIGPDKTENQQLAGLSINRLPSQCVKIVRLLAVIAYAVSNAVKLDHGGSDFKQINR